MKNNTEASSRQRKLEFLKNKRLSCTECRYWALKIPGPFCSKHNFLIPEDIALACIDFEIESSTLQPVLN